MTRTVRLNGGQSYDGSHWEGCMRRIMGTSCDHEGENRRKKFHEMQETFVWRRITTKCMNVGLKSSTIQEGTSLKNINYTRYEAKRSYIARPLHETVPESNERMYDETYFSLQALRLIQASNIYAEQIQKECSDITLDKSNKCGNTNHVRPSEDDVSEEASGMGKLGPT